MHKRTQRFPRIDLVMYLVMLGFVFLGLLPVLKIPAEEESITLTTYYPAPYGVYNSLAVNRLGVGDYNGDGILNHGDVPTTNGDVWIEGNVSIHGGLNVNNTVTYSGPDNTGIRFTNDNKLYWDGGAQIQGYDNAATLLISPDGADSTAGVVQMNGHTVDIQEGLELGDERKTAWPQFQTTLKWSNEVCNQGILGDNFVATANCASPSKRVGCGAKGKYDHQTMAMVYPIEPDGCQLKTSMQSGECMQVVAICAELE